MTRRWVCTTRFGHLSSDASHHCGGEGYSVCWHQWRRLRWPEVSRSVPCKDTTLRTLDGAIGVWVSGMDAENPSYWMPIPGAGWVRRIPTIRNSRGSVTLLHGGVWSKTWISTRLTWLSTWCIQILDVQKMSFESSASFCGGIELWPQPIDTSRVIFFQVKWHLRGVLSDLIWS